MALFKDMLNSGESLFVNEIALDYDFIPKVVPYRETQQRYLAACIKPLLNQRNGRNVIMLGPPGVGKTVACKHVLQELEETTDDVILVYINCWQKNTTYKVVIAMCDILGYKFTQNKKTEELFEIVKNMLNKKSTVFVFDEIDKAEDYDFLYSLLEEIYRKSIFLITNYKSWIDEMDERIRSRLLPDILEFKPYNAIETKGILQERAGYAFPPNAFEPAAFDFLAKKTFEVGDIRAGLHLLRESGLIAEDSSSKKITLEHAQKACSKLQTFSAKDTEELDEDSKKILELIRGNSGKKIGDLFKIYQELGGQLVYKSFQRRVNKLDENKFIKTEKLVGGAEGNTTILKIAIDKKLTEFD